MNTKEKIFETALDLFSRNGFKATSIRDITRETGLSVASFYNHFKSKNELLQAIYDYYSGLYHSKHDTAPDSAKLLDQLGPFKFFEYINHQIVESMLDEKLVKLTRVIVNEQYTNKMAGEITLKDRQRLLANMEELITMMSQKNMIKVEDPKAIGRIFGYIYLGFATDNIYYSILGNEDPHDLAEKQSKLILSLLKEIVAD